MVITEERRQTLIDRNNAIIEMCSKGIISEIDQLDIENARITLAALEAEPIGYHREDARECFRVLPYDDGVYKIAVYAAPTVPVLKHEPPIAWLNDAYLGRGVVDGEAGSDDQGPGYIPVYRHPQNAVLNPVVLSDCDFATVSHMSNGSKDYCNGFVDGVNHAAKQVSAAGYPVTDKEPPC